MITSEEQRTWAGTRTEKETEKGMELNGHDEDRRRKILTKDSLTRNRYDKDFIIIIVIK